MPSLGKSVRALLKGANDGAPRTQVADLHVGAGKKLSEMELHENTASDVVANMNARPGYPGEEFSPVASMVSMLPWKNQNMFHSAKGEKAVRKLLELVTKSDTKGLEKWSQQHLGGSWEQMKPIVLDFL